MGILISELKGSLKELPDLLAFGESDFVMVIDGLACQFDSNLAWVKLV